MYALRFSNSIGHNFPTYQRSHENLDSVALEILRVREELDIMSTRAAHEPIVEDYTGKEIFDIPHASHRREMRPKLSAPKTHASGTVTQTILRHDIFEITEIDGRHISSRWVGSAT